jgi:hypothetical protein
LVPYDNDLRLISVTILYLFYKLETYSRSGLLQSYGNLQSYWTTTKLWKLTVVLYYYKAIETYSRIVLLQSYRNLQSYCTTTKLLELTVVYEAMELTVVLDYSESRETSKVDFSDIKYITVTWL